jgi:hypothetical protein
MYCDKIQDSTSTSVKSPEAEQESSSFFFAALSFVHIAIFIHEPVPSSKEIEQYGYGIKETLRLSVQAEAIPQGFCER